MKKIIFDCPPSLLRFMKLYCERSGLTRAEFVRFCIRHYISTVVSVEYTEEMRDDWEKLLDLDVLEMHASKGVKPDAEQD